MRIQVLRNLGEGMPNYKERQVVDTSDDEGSMLVGKGLAVALDGSERQVMRGVPQRPAIRTAPRRDTVQTESVTTGSGSADAPKGSDPKTQTTTEAPKAPK